MDAFTNGLVLSALICFWIGEAVRDFTENKWSPLFFMDALLATAFAGILLRTIFIQ